MSNELYVLLITAGSIGFVHTLFGPDHYLPFIVMSKSGDWSLKKTTLITLICGIGHVGSSVIFGLIGIAFGIVITKITFLESFRGNIAAWGLIAFGLVYFLWGIKKAYKNQPHEHFHFHKDGEKHIHDHNHHKEHAHPHVEEGKKNMTPWILFTIFVFGPCEPLIPLLMYPAAKNSYFDLALVTLVFAVATISTMLVIVLVSAYGISFLPMSKLEKYTHAIAGATIFMCGIAIVFLGL